MRVRGEHKGKELVRGVSETSEENQYEEGVKGKEWGEGVTGRRERKK